MDVEWSGLPIFDSRKWLLKIMPNWRLRRGTFAAMRLYDRWWRIGPLLIIRYRKS